MIKQTGMTNTLYAMTENGTSQIAAGSTTENALFALTGIQQRYGKRTVLDVDQLTIRPGEILALVGPSGAGKSTLLRLLNFLEPPTAGTISFLGHRFNQDEEPPLALRRKVTTVFQRPVLLRRNVAANVAYGLRLRGQRNAAEQIDATLEAVGLQALAHAPARTLSGGEAQRVALARAMILRPTALLMDEPTANLDPYNVSMIESITQRLNEQQQTTIVLVTHNIFQARRLAHRVALMLDGRIVELAETEAFFEHPQDPRTSAFVRGEMIY
jgi:tungstate transport system ATP-binding protein